MRHVPLAEFQTDIAAFVAAAQAGEDVVVMEGERESLRLTRSADERLAQQRLAAEALHRIGQEVLRTRWPTTSDERLSWIRDDQR